MAGEVARPNDEMKDSIFTDLFGRNRIAKEIFVWPSHLGMGGVFNTTNSHLYHYAGNNPVRYTDPEGQWIENEDGSYTAEEKDTLWGLSQLTGRDWKEIDYSGKPEDLQVGQTVYFRTWFDLKLERTKLFLDTTANLFTSGSQLLRSMADKGYTAATEASLPLKLMDDLSLFHDAETLKYYGEKMGKAALFAAFAFNLYCGIKTGIKTNSFWHGAYKATAGVISTGLGYIVATATSPFITPVGGIVAGLGTSLLIDYGFGKLEEFIWRKQ